MLAQTHAPAAIFGSHVRYVIPLFQRPYVWNEVDQWQPLWDDVSTLADRLLEAGSSAYGPSTVPSHFLGAIVLEQQLVPATYIGVRHVVDGQQRLTTLQLLLDAAQEIVEQLGTPMDSQALRVLVLNDASIAAHADDVFKVWPTDRDQEAFRAVMDNAAVVTPEVAGSPIAKAHAFFAAQIRAWALAEGPEAAGDRLHVLVVALRDYLKLVVIDLEAGDNAQVIFETLNHRGAPLLAADLVKNYVFQLAAAQHLDIAELYGKHWRNLDSVYWRQPVAQGRLFRPRIDVFLNYWLTMKLLREVPSDRVFSDFRDLVRSTHPDVAALLAELAHDANVYAELENAPADTVVGQFYYRVIRALDTSAVGPALLWLLRYDAQELPVDQRNRALAAIESWLVRRVLCRATAKGVNQVVVDLLRDLNKSGPATAGDVVEAFLAGQSADARLWPTDDTVRSTVTSLPLYTAVTRARLRMILEALEDSYRGALGEGGTCPRNLTIEHVIPQAWRENWMAGLSDNPQAQARRDVLIHTLGNLTLVSGKLNPTLSNRPWLQPTPDGDKGKRAYLLEHSELKLNARIVTHETGWTDDDVTTRTQALIDRVLTLWPRPQPTDAVTHATLTLEPAPDTQAYGEPDDRPTQAPTAGHAGKYRELWAWLGRQDRDDVTLTFDEVEQILGMPLPPSARQHMAHWYGYEGTALGRAIRDAGWRASGVDLADELVTFVREP